MSKRTNIRMLITVSSVISICLLVGCLYVFSLTRQLVFALETQQISLAARNAKNLSRIATLASIVTAKQIPDIEVAQAFTLILADAPAATTIASDISNSLATEHLSISPSIDFLSKHQDSFRTIAEKTEQTIILQKLTPLSVNKTLLPALQTTLDNLKTLQHLQTGSYRFLVVLQNSDELRATGGFMGSYALITLNNGVLTELVLEDIYDADGQFSGFVAAPPGVKEYLSSDRGLRLPDANWYPDFPQSAQQILQFFALGNRNNITGVVAITDSLLEDILELTGPIWLPDYQTSVTAENLTTVLRSQRSEFFAGSIQKKHLLEQFKNQLLLRLTSIPPENLIQTIAKAQQNKALQFFSTDETLQQFAHNTLLTGELFSAKADAGIAFVESNVGINKANRNITRELELRTSPSKLSAQLTLNNTNMPPQETKLESLAPQTQSTASEHLGYVNYQRIIVPHDWQIDSLSYNSTKISSWDENIVTTTRGQSFREYGFLLTLPEKSIGVLNATFSIPEILQGTNLEIYKQAGVDPYRVLITKSTDPAAPIQEFLLEGNHVTIMP